MIKVNLLDEVHKIIGPLAEEDAERLRQSVTRDGVIVPVIIRKATGEIIDGKHRAELTDDYPTIELDVDECEAARQAVTLNLARRHLTPDQKRELIRLLRQAKFTQEEVAEMVGVTQGRVSQVEAGIINPNTSQLKWNEETQSYEAPEIELPPIEPIPKEPEKPMVPDLRYKTGTKAKPEPKVPEPEPKPSKPHDPRHPSKKRIRNGSYRDGIEDAKRSCKEMPWFFINKDFTPRGMKRFLEYVGAPKYVIENSDKINEVSFCISEAWWKADAGRQLGCFDHTGKPIGDIEPKEWEKLQGRINYIPNWQEMDD